MAALRYVEGMVLEARSATEEDIKRHCLTLTGKQGKGQLSLSKINEEIKQLLLVLTLNRKTLLASGSAILDEDTIQLLLDRLIALSQSNKTQKPFLVFRDRVLTVMLLNEISPQLDSSLVYGCLESCTDKATTQLLFSLLIRSCCDTDNFTRLFHRLSSFLYESDESPHRQRHCLNLMSSLLPTDNKSISSYEINEVSRRLCHWILYTQVIVAGASASKGVFAGKKVVTNHELDGSASRDIFTVLNIAQHYQQEHFLNICSFSILRSWLVLVQDHDETWESVFQHLQRQSKVSSSIPRTVGESKFYDGSRGSSDSPYPQSISSSMSSLHSFLFVDDISSEQQDTSLISSRSETPIQSFSRSQSVSTPRNFDEMDSGRMSTPSLSAGVTLKGAALKYCLRILGQADRRPRRTDDKDVLDASIVEAIRILTLLCQEDNPLVNKVFPEIKRLHGRMHDRMIENRSIYSAIAQFYIEHYDSMMYNVDEFLTVYFKEIPARLYGSSSTSFELLDFCLRNKAFFQETPSFLHRYFPNIFKIIAWHPRTFLTEFVDLIPLFVSETTATELFHTIIDLPLLSSILELKQEGRLEEYVGENLEQSSGDSGLMSTASHRAMFNFFLRSESGGADTIDKLERLYLAFKPISSRTRIKVACQVVPMLLAKFFKTLLTLNNDEVFERIYPVALEKLFELYPVSSFQTEVRQLLATQLERICCQYPDLIGSQQDEILAIFNRVRSEGPSLETFIAATIWCIGEFCIQDSICNIEQIIKYYETLEILLYELVSALSSEDDFIIFPKILTALVSAIAKIGAYSQDFVPRVILSLTKLTSIEWQPGKSHLSQEEFYFVMSRAQEVVNLLRLPNVANAVLCIGDKLKPWHLDKNKSLQLKIKAMAFQDRESLDK